LRWYRRDDFDLDPAPLPVDRVERLRELVDELPTNHRHVASRMFFGGATHIDAGTEIGVSAKRARELLAEAVRMLRTALLEDDEVGSMLPARYDVRALLGPSEVAGEGEDPGPVL
jgi:DNA-directed RNA polymerase specialized sigma24 family protein